MDTRFRNLQRGARLAGLGSPEDIAYIAAQRQMGLGLSLIFAAAELGDISAREWVTHEPDWKDIFTKKNRSLEISMKIY